MGEKPISEMDEVLKRMLNTPPKPHKDSKKPKDGSDKQSDKGDEKDA